MIKIKISNKYNSKQILFEGKIKESRCIKFLKTVKRLYNDQFDMKIEMEKV